MTVRRNVLLLALLIIHFAGLALPDEAVRTLRGKIVAKGTDAPLKMAFVMIDGGDGGVSVDEAGLFALTPFDPQRHKFLMVFCDGYRTERVEITPDPFMVIALSQESMIYDEITVTADSGVGGDEKQASILRKMDVYNIPGTAADPLLTATVLPGITAPPDTSDLLIQGGAPDEVGYFYDGIEILHPFQLETSRASYFSVFDNQIIDRFNVLNTGFDAKYGNVLSGVIDITPKDDLGAREGGIGLSTIGGTGYYGMPLPARCGVLGSFRNDVSYLLTRMNRIPNDEFNNISLLGSFYHRPTPVSKIKVNWLYNRYDMDSDNDFMSNSSNSMFSLSYSNTFGSRFFSRLSVANISYKSTMTPSATFSKSFLDKATSFRSDNSVFFGENELTFGADYMRRKESILIGTGSSAPTVPLEAAADRVGTFVGGKITLNKKLLVSGGLRFSALLAGDNTCTALDPRVSLAWILSDRHVLRFSTGLYRQFGDIFYHAADPLKPKRAFHQSFSYDYLRGELSFRLSVFNKQYADLFMNGPVAGRPRTNGGEGFARGFSLYLRQSKPAWDWMLIYNFLHACRREGDVPDLTTFRYEIPHSFTGVLTWKYRGFEFGFRLGYSAGLPLTPLTGVNYDEETETYVPIYGSPYSDRNPCYLRLDLNGRRTFKLLGRAVIFHYGLINLLNRHNVSGYTFNPETGVLDPTTSIFRRSVFCGLYIPLS